MLKVYHIRLRNSLFISSNNITRFTALIPRILIIIYENNLCNLVQAVANALQFFGSISGLEPNNEKTDIYFGGVSDNIKLRIKNLTGYSEGTFPFKYLGLPLHDSHLHGHMYDALLSKIHQCITHWTTKLLSYAGRLQLLNSILFGLEGYWCNTLLLPAGLLKTLNNLCRNYLWNSQEGQHRLYMKSWLACCCPRDEGGFNIKEVLSLNRVNLCKWLWHILSNNASVWATWHTVYNLKMHTIWTAEKSAHHSESWRALLHTRDHLLHFFGTAAHATSRLLSCVDSQGHFRVAKMYELLRTKFPKVHWTNVVWDSAVIPKHSFITALAAQAKLPTVDCIIKRGLCWVNWCILCRAASETHTHLFFNCVFSRDLWCSMLTWMRLPGRSMNLRQELSWSNARYARKHWKMRWFRCCLNATTYAIWHERNTRLFTGKESSPHALVRNLQLSIVVKVLDTNRSVTDEMLDHLNAIYV
ncbi:uncharacterized protein LOC141608099 [Silene latifolia]|uniref:uncharacterized protein LOC141608099 n=1 Tax=Silene latifolia TaxID=37657 RepID=UPI003D772106